MDYLEYNSYIRSLANDAIIEHHGVKGQQKGKRRWQNEDGSLTPEGRIHYGVGDGNKDSDKKPPTKESKSTTQKTKTPPKKSPAPASPTTDTDKVKEEEAKKAATRKKIFAGVAVAAVLAMTVVAAKKYGESRAENNMRADAEQQRLLKNKKRNERRQENKLKELELVKSNPNGYAIYKTMKNKGSNIVIGNNSSASSAGVSNTTNTANVARLVLNAVKDKTIPGKRR